MFNRGWEYVVAVFGVYKTKVSGWVFAIFAIGLTITTAFVVNNPSKYVMLIRWAAILTSAAAIWMVFIAEYDAWRVERNRAKGAEKQLADIEDERPRLKLKEPGAIYIETINQSAPVGGQLYRQTVLFLKLRLVNDPAKPYPTAHARGIRAKIDFRRCSDGTHFLSIDGRWAESDQPSSISPLESKAHLLAADFGIGEERSLDVAYYDKRTSSYYAWNNDNYNYDFFTYPHHLLEGNYFQVDIRIRGEWIDELIKFRFKAHGGTFEIER